MLLSLYGIGPEDQHRRLKPVQRCFPIFLRILVNKSSKQATSALGGAQTSGCLNTCQMYKAAEGIDKSQDKTCYVYHI